MFWKCKKFPIFLFLPTVKTNLLPPFSVLPLRKVTILTKSSYTTILLPTRNKRNVKRYTRFLCNSCGIKQPTPLSFPLIVMNCFRLGTPRGFGRQDGEVSEVQRGSPRMRLWVWNRVRSRYFLGNKRPTVVRRRSSHFPLDFNPLRSVFLSSDRTDGPLWHRLLLHCSTTGNPDRNSDWGT